MARRYVIIGFGITGLSAVRSIREHDSSGEIVAITDERFAFYSRPGLAYLLTGAIPEAQLFPLQREETKALGFRGVVGRVERIDASAHSITFSDGQQMGYDRLLLATGAGAVKPSIPGIDLQGVVTLDTLEDVRRILQLTRHARQAVIVGGGITAVELAEGMTARGLETHYLLRGDRFWPRVLDAEESELVERGMTHEGIRLHYNVNVERILASRGRVKAVLTDKGEKLKCQIVGVAIGIRPNTSLAVSTGLEVERGIIVDEQLRTSDADIFAAGDVAQVYDPFTGNYTLDSLWWLAQEQGRIVGGNMAGRRDAYIRSIPFNVTRVGGVITTIIGSVGQASESDDLVSIVHGDSENWRHHAESFEVESQQGINRIRLVVGDQSLVGAVIMGDQTLANSIHELIRNQTDLGRFRQILLHAPERSLEVLQTVAQKSKRNELAEAR
ncbi:MAG: NAD(P)/FAD-dependent oxidoreductase [Anaerolineales bacterium]|nr:MAG: NAD(P)/FAD-dependent oxidoreductase [Anaerolineales bacterium]